MVHITNFFFNGVFCVFLYTIKVAQNTILHCFKKLCGWYKNKFFFKYIWKSFRNYSTDTAKVNIDMYSWVKNVFEVITTSISKDIPMEDRQTNRD